jgi:malate dehydrogenase (oxaloacetate-decarboxylating)
MNDERDGLRDGQPDARGHAEEARPYAADHRHGPLGLPEPDQQRPLLPGIFRGALDVRAREISENMKMAAARGIAAIVSDSELREDYIIPSVFNRNVADAVAAAVAAEAKAEGAATAHGDEIGFAPGDTADFRAIEAPR